MRQEASFSFHLRDLPILGTSSSRALGIWRPQLSAHQSYTTLVWNEDCCISGNCILNTAYACGTRETDSFSQFSAHLSWFVPDYVPLSWMTELFCPLLGWIRWSVEEIGEWEGLCLSLAKPSSSGRSMLALSLDWQWEIDASALLLAFFFRLVLFSSASSFPSSLTLPFIFHRADCTITFNSSVDDRQCWSCRQHPLVSSAGLHDTLRYQLKLIMLQQQGVLINPRAFSTVHRAFHVSPPPPISSRFDRGDVSFILLAGALVFFMVPGVGPCCGGSLMSP